jgi:hypothetical protein
MRLSKIVRWPARKLIQFLAKRSPAFAGWFGNLMVAISVDRDLERMGFRREGDTTWVKDD